MADRSGDDEQVPDEMVVADAVRGEEREPAGVRNSARQDQQNSGHRNSVRIGLTATTASQPMTR